MELTQYESSIQQTHTNTPQINDGHTLHHKLLCLLHLNFMLNFIFSFQNQIVHLEFKKTAILRMQKPPTRNSIVHRFFPSSHRSQIAQLFHTERKKFIFNFSHQIRPGFKFQFPILYFILYKYIVHRLCHITNIDYTHNE